ncbi:MAG: ornithine carbamoyltransferase [Gammaproteobacteria bacterium]|nr:ornithine carbamoyltransferase [Gammaproteobacteria bacterium]
MNKKHHFLSLLDHSPENLKQIIARAHQLKKEANRTYRPLIGRTAALLLSLNSTRTRVAFETGMSELGGHTIVLNPNETQLGRGEPIEDMAKVLSEMVDVIIIRTLEQNEIDTFARFSDIPVINAMSSKLHPCQLLADIQTFEELKGPIEGKTVAFLGDGNNMCNSYINAAHQWDFNLKIACPIGYEPDSEFLQNFTNTTLTDDPVEATENADLVVTDVWSSMGYEQEANERKKIFSPYQVNESLLDKAKKDAIFMHCLPAHRGEEISHNLLDDPRSVVWQEAGNRLHSQKALLEFLLTEG